MLVSPFVARRVGVVVKETVRATARERFEASVRAKIEGLGSEIIDIVYVHDDADAVETALGRFTRGAETADLVLTAGSASTDPEDAFFVAIDALGGRVVRRGVLRIRLDAVAGTRRRDVDPRPTDLRCVFEGHGRRPAPAAVARR